MKHKLISGLITALAVAMIIFAIAAMVTVFTTEKGKAPSLGGFSAMRVISGSMEPSIKAGSVVLVQRTPTDKLVTGDAITFYSRDIAIPGEINTHRILRSEPSEIVAGARQFITRGDANRIEDPAPVQEQDVIGKVVFSSWILGAFIGIVASKWGFLVVIIVPLLIIFFSNLGELIRIFRQAVDEEIEKELEEEAAEEEKTSERDIKQEDITVGAEGIEEGKQ